MDKIKVLYIPSLNIPVCYWRIETYAQQMVKLKSKCAVHVEYFTDILEINAAWDDACIGKGKISEDIQYKLRNAFIHFDVIIFQRIQNMPALALIQELRKEFPDVKIVAEIDDSIGEVSLSSPYRWTDQHRWSAEHLHKSDGVICSTQYLADSIKPIVGDKPVHVAPNCILKDIWKFKKKKKDPNRKGIRIGYVAGGAHDEDIYLVYKAILPIFEDNPDVTWVIRYGGWRPEFLKEHPNIDFEQINWHMGEYPQNLVDMDLDFALAPLRDTEFNRCKSNVKWIEWSILGIPMLASRVEPYKNTKGFIELTNNRTESWRSSLRRIIYEMRQNPPKYLPSLNEQNKKSYNINKETHKVLKFLNSLL